jgi:dienelactone hydrolase
MSVKKALGVLFAAVVVVPLSFTACFLVRVAGMHPPAHAGVDTMQGFDRFPFTPTGAEKPLPVFFSPKKGPPVILLHELPGMTPECVCFARRLSAAGFTVYMPLLFGCPGKRLTTREEFFGVCRRPDLECYANRPSRLADSLVPLVDEIQRRYWSRATPVGAIGMCLTGNFPLVLLRHPCVRAVVLSQPALPLPLLPGKARDLGIDSTQIACVKASKSPILVFRFTTDPISREARLNALKHEFKGQVEIYPVFARKTSHPVFTDSYRANWPETEIAERHLVEFLRAHLNSGAAEQIGACGSGG